MSASKQVKDETNLMQENLSGAIAEEPAKVTKKEEKKSPEMAEIKLEDEMDEQVDMSGMINRNFVQERLSQTLDLTLHIDFFFINGLQLR